MDLCLSANNVKIIKLDTVVKRNLNALHERIIVFEKNQ